MLRGVVAALCMSLFAVASAVSGAAQADVPGTTVYGYALLDAGSALYGVPTPCSGVLASAPESVPQTARRAVGMSFPRDPILTGQVRVAFDDGTVNDAGSPAAGLALNAPLVAVATAPIGRGYWLAAADGGVFAGRDAPFVGSMGGHQLNAPAVGIASTPSRRGYWLAAADGGVFAFGDALFAGSLGDAGTTVPIVGIAPTPSGRGYWLTNAKGGVFAFGDAEFLGSRSGADLNAPIVGIAATPGGSGYWLAAADGGVFAYGDAVMNLSLADRRLRVPVVAIALWPQRCP